MNKEEISGKVDQLVGKVKQGIGEAIGKQKVANQGVIDQAKGAALQQYASDHRVVYSAGQPSSKLA